MPTWTTEFNSSDMVQVFSRASTRRAERQAGEMATGTVIEFHQLRYGEAFAGGGYEQGPRTDTLAVPEPAGGCC